MPYAHVQTVTINNAAATISASTAGSLLILCGDWDNGDAPDSVTAGFVPAGALLTTGFYSSRCWYYENNPGGITSVGITAWPGGTPDHKIFVSEYTGIATASSLIVAQRQRLASPGTGTDAATSGNGNVTAQPALIYGYGATPQDNPGYGTGTGFTSRATNSDGSRVEDKRVTATGDQAATFTLGSNPVNGSFVWMMAFAEAGGGISLAWIRA